MSRTLLHLMFILCLSPLSTLIAQQIDIAPIHEAFIPKFTDPLPIVTLAQAPPEVREENIPSKPYEDAVWIPGYWAWIQEKNNFYWVCGVWRRPPPSAPYWIPGKWNKMESGWVFSKGFWSNTPQNQIKLIKKAPPAAISDTIVEAPGPDYFFATGHWDYDETSDQFTWLSGSWQKANPQWVLAPACYIWRPSGYVFSPIYWDFPLDKRGIAYNCQDSGDTFIAIRHETILQKLFVYYPDYCLFYWHWFHYHPQWAWEGCGCVPPWWSWHDWWYFGWSDSWGLWWWWSHPGSFGPWWLTLDLSSKIAPPPQNLVNALKHFNKPELNLKFGDKILTPSGTLGNLNIPFPSISNDVKPGGKIKLPNPPDKQDKEIKIPPIPPQYEEPKTPYYPQETYYSPNDRIPDKFPPGRYPPRLPPRGEWDDDHDHPRWPSRDDDHHDRPKWPPRHDDHDNRPKWPPRDDSDHDHRPKWPPRGDKPSDNQPAYPKVTPDSRGKNPNWNNKQNDNSTNKR